MNMIPPFVQQIIGALVRAAVVWLAATFGAHISEDEAVKLTAQIAPVVAVLAWSLWQKYRGRQKLLTAAGSPKVMTESQVEALVKDPTVPTPSVLTPKTELPQ